MLLPDGLPGRSRSNQSRHYEGTVASASGQRRSSTYPVWWFRQCRTSARDRTPTYSPPPRAGAERVRRRNPADAPSRVARRHCAGRREGTTARRGSGSELLHRGTRAGQARRVAAQCGRRRAKNSSSPPPTRPQSGGSWAWFGVQCTPRGNVEAHAFRQAVEKECEYPTRLSAPVANLQRLKAYWGTLVWVDNGGMLRDKNLIPLSHQHQHALAM